MKPYFEEQGVTIPFSAVLCIRNRGSYYTIVYSAGESDYANCKDFEQLRNYKNWLENRG